MKTLIVSFAGLLLLLNGIGALYGGWSLITDSSGDGLHLPLSYLEHTPFDNYFIPGLILFSAIGVFSLIVLFTLMIRSQHAAKFIMVQGLILTGWIVTQILMIRIVYWLHWLFGGIGVVLMITGFMLYLLEKRKSK